MLVRTVVPSACLPGFLMEYHFVPPETFRNEDIQQLNTDRKRDLKQTGANTNFTHNAKYPSINNHMSKERLMCLMANKICNEQIMCKNSLYNVHAMQLSYYDKNEVFLPTKYNTSVPLIAPYYDKH